jgi:type III pantothenate kinase
MMLAVDVGNTNITYGIFEGDRLRATWRVATVVNKMADEYAPLLLNLMEREGLKAADINAIAICSVVPPVLAVLNEVFRDYFHVTPLVIGPGVRTGVRVRMLNPREVGADRIVNVAAAHHLYQGAVIIVDLGTATTFDTMSADGDYLGGAIATGIGTAADALFSRASALPRVELAHPEHAIGNSTVTAMQSGIVYGYVSLVEGLVVRIKKELREEARVVATGGYAELIANETRVIDEVNPDLTLIGLQLIYRMNRD